MAERTPILAANWKMHKTIEEARSFLRAFVPRVEGLKDREIVISPPYTALYAAAQELKGVSNCFLSAQNMHFEEKGAYTGEISPIMLKEIGVDFSIIGHSERRHVFMESDQLIGEKVASAVSHGLTPILCVGETIDEREKGDTIRVIDRQLQEGTSALGQEEAARIVIAYEPVWAIGTGKTATPELAQEIHAHIRNWLKTNYNSSIAKSVRILYGGSVKPGNIKGLMAQLDIDGVLVGGASLDWETFERIVRFDS